MHQVKKEAFTKRKQFHIDNSNGLCDHCNYYQQVKIEKLADFKPKNEVRFWFILKKNHFGLFF